MLIVIGFIVLFGVLAYLGHVQAKKRREALEQLALELGFRFSPEKDARLAAQFGFLENMDDGHRRYAFNVLSGAAQDGMPVRIFDYHYETYSRDSKGRSSTQHHYFSIFTLGLPQRFPELTIEREGFFSKIGQAIGFDDIDFESLEFSRRYKVKSRDKKFAYDFCNARMIDYLLQQPDQVLEVDGSTLSLTFRGKLAVEAIRPNFERLQRIRSLMPNFLFSL
ncbi:MAG: hypothetical protein ACI81V_000435 [Lentimonas sp.]|jgi:hypothetical protein